jgi:hypothetical protein
MRCFSSLGSLYPAYAFSGEYLRVTQVSFLIQTSRDQRSFASFPGLIAGYHVFRRLSMPRHPPCTLSSLTTVTDHRPASLGKTRAVRTAGNGSDQSITRSAAAARDRPGRYSLARRDARRPRLVRQKGARRPPAKTGKTLSPPPGLVTRPTWKTKRRGSRILRGLTPRGDTRPRGLQNLLLNLYSLVKERLISQAPPNAGESAVRRKQPADSFEFGLALRSPVHPAT